MAKTTRRDFLQISAANKDIKGVWWLSGDLHFGSVGSVGATGPRSRMREVLMGPGGSDPQSPGLPSAQSDQAIDVNNYTIFRADPNRRKLTVTFINPRGREIFQRTYDA
jgi:hypothetical protein